MSQADALYEVKAFAQVYGFDVIRGYGPKSYYYTITHQCGGMQVPCCPYMEPRELAIWADGFRAGMANASDAPTQAEE